MSKDLNLSGTANFYFKNEIPYTSVPKEYLKSNLSIKAKGLLTIIYTLPNEWEFNMKGLARISNLTIKQLKPIIKEIEEKHYIQRDRKKDHKGKFYYEYIIFLSDTDWKAYNCINSSEYEWLLNEEENP